MGYHSSRVMTSTSRRTNQARGRRRLTATAIASALDLQRRVFEGTGRWLRIGEILLLRGDLVPDSVKDFRGSALFPLDGTTLPAAELYGEIALRRALIKPEQFVECIDAQIDDREAKRPHRLVGSLLVEKGYLKPQQLDECEEELRHDVKLHQDEARRTHGNGADDGKPILTAIDGRYLRAARTGELPAEEIFSALGLVRRIQSVLDRRVALWELLVAQGTVTLQTHLRLLDGSLNVTSPTHGSWMLGGLLVELGYATPQDVADALAARAAEARRTGRPPRRVGEILVEKGVLTSAELEEALRVQAIRRGKSPDGRRGGRIASFLVRNRLVVALAVVAALAVAVGAAWAPVRTRQATRTLADVRVPLEERAKAARRLGEEGAEDSVRLVARIARDSRESPELRAACLRAIATSPHAAAAEALEGALGDEAAGARGVAAWILGDRRSPAVRGALRALLGDSDGAVRIAAARALARVGEIDGREALVGALGPGAPELRRLAGDLGRPEADLRHEVIAALEESSGFKLGGSLDAWTSWLALQPTADELVGRQRGPAAVARFHALLASERLSVRFGAARALAHLGDLRGAPLLVRALDAEDVVLASALLEDRGLDIRRLAPEVVRLLTLLSGESHGPDAAAWRRWLDARRPGGDT